MKPEIISQTPVSIADLKKELADIKKRDKELNFRSNKTEEYLDMFVEHPQKMYDELKKKIEDLKISRLKPEMLIKILDTLPKTVDDLKNLLQGYVVSLGNEDIKKIVKVIEETVPEKK